MTACTVVRPGLLTTVQDLGRWGYQDRGVPVAGPMDAFSHRLANRLVGNDDQAAALEITLVGPELRASGELSVRGHGRRVRGVRRRAAASNAAGRSASRAGPRCASAAGWPARARPWRSAAGSTCRRCSAAVRRVSSAAWDRSADARSSPAISSRSVAPAKVPRTARWVSRCVFPKAARACAPFQARSETCFAAVALERLFSAPFTVTTQSNRMGFRLEGPELSYGEAARHPLGRDAARFAAGAEIRPADPADGRPPDDRRVSEDCDGDRGRRAAGRPAGAWRLDSLRSVHARRRARRAHPARAPPGRAGVMSRVRSRDRRSVWHARRASGAACAAHDVQGRRARRVPVERRQLAAS